MVVIFVVVVRGIFKEQLIATRQGDEKRKVKREERRGEKRGVCLLHWRYVVVMMITVTLW